MNEEEFLKIRAERLKLKAIEKVSTIEKKRKSLPEVELTELEREVLAGIALGRSGEEMEAALRLYSAQYRPYTSIAKTIMRKFEAFTLAHTIYKAMKMGIVE